MKRSFSPVSRRLWPVSAAGAMALAAACSSSKNDGPPDASHYAGALAASFCSVLKVCCDAKSYPYDDASCTAQLTAVFQRDADSVKRGNVIYDKNAVGACATALDEREARCGMEGGAPDDDGSLVDPVVSACWPVFKGVLAAGDVCKTARDCASPAPEIEVSCREEPPQMMPGPGPTVCFQTKEHALPGEDCNDIPVDHTFVTCEPGLAYCDKGPPPENIIGKCRPLRKVGESCVGALGELAPCDPVTSACDFVRTHKCVALPGPGQPCFNDGAVPCAEGLYCDYRSPRICLPMKEEGLACNQQNECISASCTGEIPFFPDGGMHSGTCDPPPTSIANPGDVSPRSCGFGPLAEGPRDAGIKPPREPSVAPATARRWFEAFR